MPEEKREVREITLPQSQKKVEILTYYERGERLKIEAVLHEHGSMELKNNAKGNPEPMIKMDMAGQAAQREKAIEIAVRTIDGKPATIADINKLRNKDAMFLEAEVAKIDQDEEVKKN